MKKNIMLFIIIGIILLFIGGLTYYKFGVLSKDVNDNEENKKEEPIINSGPKQDYTYDIDYNKIYSNSIINIIKTTYDFQLEISNQIMYASVYIDNSKNLYIVDKNNNSRRLLVEDKKFKTLYSVDTNNPSTMILYALSEEGKVYFVSLNSKNILDVIVKELEFSLKVNNFTNLKLKGYSKLNYASVVVYAEDEKMYDVLSGVQFNENILVVMNDYIIYEDYYLSDMSGKMLIDFENEKIKVKEIIVPIFNDKFKFPGMPNVMFITETGKLFYMYGENKAYVSENKIKEIKQDGDSINIIFSDNTTMEINGFLDKLD